MPGRFCGDFVLLYNFFAGHECRNFITAPHNICEVLLASCIQLLHISVHSAHYWPLTPFPALLGISLSFYITQTNGEAAALSPLFTSSILSLLLALAVSLFFTGEPVKLPPFPRRFLFAARMNTGPRDSAAARVTRGSGWTWPCAAAVTLAFAALILYLPSSSGGGSSSSSKPHFLLSNLLQQHTATGAEWVPVSLVATAGVVGACLVAAMHARGDCHCDFDDDDYNGAI
jgi:hypothetical protein